MPTVCTITTRRLAEIPVTPAVTEHAGIAAPRYAHRSGALQHIARDLVQTDYTPRTSGSKA